MRSRSSVASPLSSHVSTIAGSPAKAGWPRKTARPSPISPLPTSSWRSRFEPSGVCESFTWRTRSRSSPMRASRSSSGIVEHAGIGHVDPGRPPVARVDADPEARMPVDRVGEHLELGDRAADRSAGARGVLQAQPEVVGRQLEQLAKRGHDELHRVVEAEAEVRADVEDDRLGADRVAPSPWSRAAQRASSRGRPGRGSRG